VLEPLIDAASELPRNRWPAFLDDACGADAQLRVELEQLLLQYDRADTLLDHPAAERFASLFCEVAAPPPELVNGEYRIERKVGQGGMAAVYLAHDLRHDRKVAVKILHPELTAAFRAERFLAEIRTMAQLHHPHILPLHDSGEADGVLFYVMPYVEGETLRQRIDRERQLAPADAGRIVREVAAALDSAHRRGVVHRDIKPENILLDDGGALVADFGIALAVSTASAPQADQPAWRTRCSPGVRRSSWAGLGLQRRCTASAGRSRRRPMRCSPGRCRPRREIAIPPRGPWRMRSRVRSRRTERLPAAAARHAGASPWPSPSR
jgi:serine/threonine-protein kinase